MDISTLIQALIASTAVIAMLVAIVYQLIKPDLENLRNIPDKAWFDKVGAAVDRVTELKTDSGYVNKRLDNLEDRVSTLERK